MIPHVLTVTFGLNLYGPGVERHEKSPKSDKSYGYMRLLWGTPHMQGVPVPWGGGSQRVRPRVRPVQAEQAECAAPAAARQGAAAAVPGHHPRPRGRQPLL